MCFLTCEVYENESSIATAVDLDFLYFDLLSIDYVLRKSREEMSLGASHDNNGLWRLLLK